MLPDDIVNFQRGGGRFRTRPGAPLSPRDVQSRGPLGVAQNPLGGLSREANWRSFFGARTPIDPATGRGVSQWGLQGKNGSPEFPATPARPVPDSDNPMVTHPGAMMADTHRQWAEDARDRTSYKDPYLNVMVNGDLEDSPDNPSLLGQPDPSAAPPVPAPAAKPDLSTPEGLIAHANQTSTNYFNSTGQAIPTPVAGQVQGGTQLQTPYGTASVRDASNLASN